jgi:hypothetical protein
MDRLWGEVRPDPRSPSRTPSQSGGRGVTLSVEEQDAVATLAHPRALGCDEILVAHQRLAGRLQVAASLKL